MATLLAEEWSVKIPEQNDYLVWGEGAIVHPLAKIIAREHLFLDDHAIIGDFAFVNASGYVRLGKYSHLAPHALIVGGGIVHVGDFSEVSYGAKIIAGTDDIMGPHLFTPGVPAEHRRIERGAGRYPGSFVAIGANCIVYPGVTVGDGAVVMPGTIVRASLKAWHVYDGPSCDPVGKRQHKEALMERATKLLGRRPQP